MNPEGFRFRMKVSSKMKIAQSSTAAGVGFKENGKSKDTLLPPPTTSKRFLHYKVGGRMEVRPPPPLPCMLPSTILYEGSEACKE
eukprot:4912138-Amphidinium_carterae.2